MAHVYRGGVKIETGRRVTVRVELTVVGGGSLEKKTVEYIQGSGTMLPALEKLLTGLEKGAKRDGVLKAKEAFLRLAEGTPFRYLDAGPLVHSRTVERLTFITCSLGRQLNSYPRMNWRLLTQPENVAA